MQAIYTADSKKTYRIAPGTCYACDAANAGVTLHNGEVKSACKRHMDPTIKAAHFCQYCDEPVRKGSAYVDTAEYAHVTCLKRDAKANS